MCLSINFSPRMLLCELNSQKKNSSLSLIHDGDFLYKEIPDIVDYKEKKCGKTSCNLYSKCVRTKSDKYACMEVAVHGGWSEWNSWGDCSDTGGLGNRTRKRRCDNPTPRFGGKACSGQSSDSSPCNLPDDCKSLHDNGSRTSGVYSINPWGELHNKSVEIYCDMSTSGGGWTVIQKRVDGKVNFNRSWQEYKAGFGDVSTSHWIGNEIIHQLTKKNSSTLYVSITLKNGTTLFIQYDTFSISGENDDYRLYIAGKATGMLDDRIRYGTGADNINGMKFSTYDKDNDLAGSKCTDAMGIGGWWFNSCSNAYLNGQYPPGKWKQPWYPPFSDGSHISETTMMIRRK
ncbi:ficolin-3-like [Saccostrea echinata]|uniref:ficolin-3-like n=1 Tax=Saccostrea echinata TaxID=191078 RepID=UPI002A81800B|nr:ficolin-3-like [Saccostrea echinata]